MLRQRQRQHFVECRDDHAEEEEDEEDGEMGGLFSCEDSTKGLAEQALRSDEDGRASFEPADAFFVFTSNVA
jgi:hypothetical protein